MSTREDTYDGLVVVDVVGGIELQSLCSDLAGSGDGDEVVVVDGVAGEQVSEEQVAVRCISGVGADDISQQVRARVVANYMVG